MTQFLIPPPRDEPAERFEDHAEGVPPRSGGVMRVVGMLVLLAAIGTMGAWMIADSPEMGV